MIRRQSAALLTAVKTEKRSKYTPESAKVSQTADIEQGRLTVSGIAFAPA